MASRPIRVAVAYLIAAVAYIMVSDFAVHRFLPEAEQAVQLGKGVGFVCLTALILYGLLHRWQNRLDATREQIAAQRWYLESLLATVTDWVTVLDDGGAIIFTNRAIEKILGFSREEVSGTIASNLVHEEDRAEVVRALAAARAAPGAIQRVSYRARRKGKGWVQLESVGVKPIGGDIEGVVVSSRDVGPERAAEKALQDKDAQLKQVQKMEAVGRLAGGVAHDFNNLLTVIFSYATLLAHEIEDEQSLADLQAIVEASQESAELTRQLLLFSRQQAAEMNQVVVNHTLGRIEKLLRRTIGEDVSLHIDLGSDVPGILINEGQLTQVLMNLVVNARDAMPRGGSLRIVSLGVDVGKELAARGGLRPGRYACIEVRDTGTGMDERTRAQVFDAFFSTKGARGTGLGLSTSSGIVSSAGGFIDVESEPGRGSTFRVYLPRAQGKTKAVTLPPRAARAPRHGQILVVEDDRAVRLAVCRLLDRVGFSVHGAGSVDEARQLAQRRAFDLLITDIVMPHEMGTTLAIELLASQACGGVLYVSGYTPEELSSRGVDHQDDLLLLRKPFTEDELLDKVELALDARSSPG